MPKRDRTDKVDPAVRAGWQKQIARRAFDRWLEARRLRLGILTSKAFALYSICFAIVFSGALLYANNFDQGLLDSLFTESPLSIALSPLMLTFGGYVLLFSEDQFTDVRGKIFAIAIAVGGTVHGYWMLDYHFHIGEALPPREIVMEPLVEAANRFTDITARPPSPPPPNVITFYSKIDGWFGAAMTGAFLFSFALMPLALTSRSRASQIGVTGVLIFVATLIGSVFFTRYEISNGTLAVKAWPIHRLDIPIAKIYRIERTHSGSSAPALSFDRLEISYQGGIVMISPREEESLVQVLLAENPFIIW